MSEVVHAANMACASLKAMDLKISATLFIRFFLNNPKTIKNQPIILKKTHNDNNRF